MYDVPESSRQYRDVLRGFLKKQRLGCLQKSIYITPNDIRPEFADLKDAIEVDQYAYLFESRTVLGLDPMMVVKDAWNWRAINGAHAWFNATFEKKLIEVKHDLLDRAALQTLAREEMAAYATVMENDPLLPEALLPQDYLGGAVLNLHRSIIETIAGKLKARPRHP
jgi:DNA-binding transcriptional regulator PaaX